MNEFLVFATLYLTGAALTAWLAGRHKIVSDEAGAVGLSLFWPVALPVLAVGALLVSAYDSGKARARSNYR